MVTLAPNIVDAATVLLGAHPAVNQVEVRMKGSELHFLSISAHCNESLQYMYTYTSEAWFQCHFCFCIGLSNLRHACSYICTVASNAHLYI